jgi:hypothetical protein
MTQENVVETRTVCYNHPNRETYLRCNRCERPICTECAVLTPTGYRCKQCVKGQLKVFETARWIDYPLAMLIGAALSFLGSLIAQSLGWFILFVAPIIGVIIAEAIRWTVRRRRSRLLFQLATLGVVLGALPLLLIDLFVMLASGGGVFGLLGLVWPAFYTFLVATTTYYRLSGIQIR